MKVKLISIGNSKGIRLPGAVIRQYNLEDEIELVPGEEGLWIKPSPKNRADWEDQFKKAVSIEPETGKKEWINIPNGFDQTEWEW